LHRLKPLAYTFFIFIPILLLSSCSTYKQNILFKIPEGYKLKQEIQQVEGNYIIQKDDLLQLEVYANNGEKIIDPNLERVTNTTSPGEKDKISRNYLVNIDGNVKFPLLNELKLEGLTIRQAEDSLQKEYGKFYQNPFVTLTFANKRVVVLGTPQGQVIPLVHENMRLTEVLALSKGITNDARAHNIRIIRGEEIYVADLSTFSNYEKNNIIMQPNDIVYIEPIRKPILEGLRDYGSLISIISSLTTLIVIIVGAN
jgi:polysaccharide biosynthesis/export protein